MAYIGTITVKPISPVQYLNMPASQWKDLDENVLHGWSAALGSAVGMARNGIVTVLIGPDGRPVAEIGPPGHAA